MTYIPVTLGIARNVGSAQPSSKKKPIAKELTPELKQSVLERDHYSCRCCGFTSKKYQEVLFLNGNEKDLHMDNMATTCIFCHQCFNLEQISLMKSGVLIWLPEVEQHILHHVARAVYVARISQGPMADSARRMLEIIMARREEVRKRLGTDDPFILASVLMDYLGPRTYAERGKKLAGVRLFPLDRRIISEEDLQFNQFPQILAYWRSKDGPFGGKVPAGWLDSYRALLNEAA